MIRSIKEYWIIYLLHIAVTGALTYYVVAHPMHSRFYDYGLAFQVLFFALFIYRVNRKPV